MTDTQNPVTEFLKMIKNDQDLQWVWYCNIRMPIYDTLVTADPPNDHGSARITSRRAAVWLMSHLFEVDISKHDLFTCETDDVTQITESVGPGNIYGAIAAAEAAVAALRKADPVRTAHMEGLARDRLLTPEPEAE